MSADSLIQYTSWFIYIVTFVMTTVRAVRRPLRANVDIAFLFTDPALIIFLSLALQVGLLMPSAVISTITTALLLALPYLLLRLVDDFTDVPQWLLHGSELALVLLVLGNLLLPSPRPAWFPSIEVIFLIGLLLYSVVAFVHAARMGNGVTRRRMWAAGIGSLFLCGIFALSGLALWFPNAQGLTSGLAGLCGLASAVCYYLGFAPPTLLRRAWQEPELRAFLGRAATLPRLPDTLAIVREMEKGAASSLGAPNARIGLWDPADESLHFSTLETELSIPPTAPFTSAIAFREQRPLFAASISPDNILHAESMRKFGVRALMAAPITAGTKRLGVLAVYAPRAPIFAEEDLALVHLLADQAAVILESRALIDEATRIRAREEAARLKEDFLSAAAHDLKTPLTTLVGQTQLMERRANRMPDAPADVESIRRVAREAQRLKTLVLELLDAARAEQGQIVGERESVDLVELAQETCTRHSSERHMCIVEHDGEVTGEYDRTRILQLLENLVENAVKYSPDKGEIHIRLWREGEWNNFTVSDSGIGIDPADLPHVFDRFHRGANVDDRRFSGMGLGLYICKAIVEQHGGHISVQSKPRQGSTFRVQLPACATATLEVSAANA